MRTWLWAIIMSCAAGGVGAGPWPQERGAWFASAVTHLSWPQEIATWASYAPTGRYDAIYLEYGLTDRITLGLDLGRSISGAIKSVAFAQLPLIAPERRLKLTAQLGLGQIDGRAVVRPGFSAGLGWDGGWMTAETLVEQPLQRGGTDVKLDMTYGLNLNGDRKLILQLQSGQQAGDPAFARIAPSLVVPLRGPLSAEIGGAWGIAGDDSMGLKLGVWAKF